MGDLLNGKHFPEGSIWRWELLAEPALVQVPGCQVSRVLHAEANKNSCKGNPTQHTASIYSKLEDQLILKAAELKGRDWRAVLAFLKRNWEFLGEKGELYRSCDVGNRRLHDRLRNRASTLLGKEKEKWVSLLKFLNVITVAEWSLKFEKNLSNLKWQFLTGQLLWLVTWPYRIILLRQITGTRVLLAFRASKVSSIDNECLNVSSKIEETLANIKQRDDRYKLDANEQLTGAASASGVAKGIKKRPVKNWWRGTHSYVLFDYTCLCWLIWNGEILSVFCCFCYCPNRAVFNWAS